MTDVTTASISDWQKHDIIIKYSGAGGTDGEY